MSERILVVEDEEKLRRVIELQLAPPGSKWTRPVTAEEGLKLAVDADLIAHRPAPAGHGRPGAAGRVNGVRTRSRR